MIDRRFRLDGEVAVVTGAGGKLGSIWTDTLLEASAHVLALDRPDAAASAEFSCVAEAAGPERLLYASADVRDRTALESACDRCVGEFGVPSVLVNNAGIDQPPAASGKSYRLEDVPFEVNSEIFEVDTLGLFLVSQVFGSRMVEAGRGSIINIGSLSAYTSSLMRGEYCISKAGMGMMTMLFADRPSIRRSSSA